MIKIKARHYLYAAGVGLVLAASLFFLLFFSTFSTHDDTIYIYIDTDDTVDSVVCKLDTIGSTHSLAGFKTVARHYKYSESIKTGRYGIPAGENTFRVFRILQRGQQTPVSIVVPSVRTMEQLAARLDKQLMLDSATIAKALTDNDYCVKQGYDTTTVAALFIPNTYEMYWNISLEGLMKRMAREQKTFWKGRRTERAQAIGLTINEVVTLASIVDEETANNAEKPTIAGLYLNRLRKGMPLQADPTVRFAMRKFALRRIYKDMLKVESPYNTYLNVGLPPGPICVPSVAGIDAVLYFQEHKYLFMCAKEDFSGTHNFAATYSEHRKNAKNYVKALNERGIK